MLPVLLLAVAGRTSGGMGFASVVFILALLFVAFATAFRLRRGGRGPATNWFPRSMRNRVNEVYRREGWPEPYDERGSELPPRQRRQRQRPPED
jgi:hypothetical protein